MKIFFSLPAIWIYVHYDKKYLANYKIIFQQSKTPSPLSVSVPPLSEVDRLILGERERTQESEKEKMAGRRCDKFEIFLVGFW